MSNLDGFSLSLMFAIATFAMPGEAGMGKDHAQTPFDGAWSVLITMDRGNCDPIDRLGVDIRDGALQYAGDSAVSIRGQVVGDGRVRVRAPHQRQSERQRKRTVVGEFRYRYMAWHRFGEFVRRPLVG